MINDYYKPDPGFEDGYGGDMGFGEVPSCCYAGCGEMSDGLPCKHSMVLLEAATGGAGPLPPITIPLRNPIPIVSVTLDPDCMCDPSVLLIFTTIISLPLAAAVNLGFQVLRSIGRGAPVAIGSVFTFARSVTVLESDSFGFQVFDRVTTDSIITYSVVLSAAAITTTEQAAAGVTILNSTLSVFGI